jgi:hypothetical protein
MAQVWKPNGQSGDNPVRPGLPWPSSRNEYSIPEITWAYKVPGDRRLCSSRLATPNPTHAAAKEERDRRNGCQLYLETVSSTPMSPDLIQPEPGNSGNFGLSSATRLTATATCDCYIFNELPLRSDDEVFNIHSCNLCMYRSAICWRKSASGVAAR